MIWVLISIIFVVVLLTLSFIFIIRLINPLLYYRAEWEKYNKLNSTYTK